MKHWRRKYSLGGASSFAVSPLFAISQYSSSRHRSHGSQLQLPSRNATRRRGKRSRTPPAVIEATAAISSTGLFSPPALAVLGAVRKRFTKCVSEQLFGAGWKQVGTFRRSAP